MAADVSAREKKITARLGRRSSKCHWRAYETLQANLLISGCRLEYMHTRIQSARTGLNACQLNVAVHTARKAG